MTPLNFKDAVAVVVAVLVGISILLCIGFVIVSDIEYKIHNMKHKNFKGDEKHEK